MDRSGIADCFGPAARQVNWTEVEDWIGLAPWSYGWLLIYLDGILLISLVSRVHPRALVLFYRGRV